MAVHRRQQAAARLSLLRVGSLCFFREKERLYHDLQQISSYVCPYDD